MARRIGDICAAGEKFQAREGGEKTRWIKCGILLETDKGFRIKMDCIPLVSDGWFAVFEEERQQDSKPAPRAERAYSEPRREQAPARQQSFDTDLPPEDDIPF